MPGKLLHQVKSVKSQAAPRIFQVLSQLRPKPINVATHSVVKKLHDANNHPLHPRAARRIAEFDKDKLHLLVITQAADVKKATVRLLIVRRVRHLLFDALKERGFNWDGTLRSIPTQSEAGNGKSVSLSGAHRLTIVNVPVALNTSTEDVRAQCRDFVKHLIHLAETKNKPAQSKAVQRLLRW